MPIADHAKDAAISRTGTGFSIEAEQEGTTVDVAKSLTALEEYLNQGWKHDDFTQEMVLVKEEPKIKAADLETIQDELGILLHRRRRRRAVEESGDRIEEA